MHEDEDVTDASSTGAAQVTSKENLQSSSAAVQPYEFCRLDISLDDIDLHLVPTGQLVEWLAEVVAVESPVHWLEAGRRIAGAVGIQRLGHRIQDALRLACRTGSKAKKFVYKDDFLSTAAQGHCHIRDRSGFSQQTKKLEYVSHEEICAAIEHVVLAGFGIRLDDLPVTTCRLLGFARVTEDMRSVISESCNSLISQGRLERRAELVVHSTVSVLGSKIVAGSTPPAELAHSGYF